MIKVLIVEDEILARSGFRNLIPWSNMGFDLLPDAEDGNEAIASLEKDHPEIMLLDINIPAPNGLDILKYIKNNDLICKVIVISCNNDFDTVKSAMKLGATDYLLKLNLSEHELVTMLLQCKELILKEENKKFTGPTLRLNDYLSYDDIINGTYKKYFSIEQPIEQQRGCTICISDQHMDPKNIIYIKHLVINYLSTNTISSICVSRELLLIFLLPGMQSDRFPAEKLLQLLQGSIQQNVYIGIGPEYQNAREVRDSLLSAEQIFMVSFYSKKEFIVDFSRDKIGYDTCPFDFLKFIDQYKEALDIFSEEKLNTTTVGLFYRIRGTDYIKVHVLRRMFLDVLSAFSANAQMLGGSIEEIDVQGDNYHYQHIMTIDSLNDMENWFIDFGKKYIHVFHVRYLSKQSELLKDVLTYIDANLMQSIQLSTAAKKLSVSESYLSSFFKKKMGTNFISYVNKKKTELAKDLLSRGYLVHQVSDMLGFENCTYFSKVFKRYCDETPDIYRKNGNEIAK